MRRAYKYARKITPSVMARATSEDTSCWGYECNIDRAWRDEENEREAEGEGRQSDGTKRGGCRPRIDRYIEADRNTGSV